MVLHDRVAVAISVISGVLWFLCFTVWRLWRRQRGNADAFSARMDSLIRANINDYAGMLESINAFSREQGELIRRIDTAEDTCRNLATANSALGTLHGELARRFTVADQERDVFEQSLTAIEKRIDQRDAMHADLARQVTALQVTLVATRELIAATSENFGLRMEALSRRLIDLETATPSPPREEEDEPEGASSWATAQAAAERGQGIR